MRELKKMIKETVKTDIENQMGWLGNMLKQIDNIEEEDGKDDKV